MPTPVTLIVGLDVTEADELAAHVAGPTVVSEMLPKYQLVEGRLFVDDRTRWGITHEVRQVVNHAIFDIADDLHWLSTLALWGGRCLPSAWGMLMARPRVQNLTMTSCVSRYATLPRGYVRAGETIVSESRQVAKWGEWHCGEGKETFQGERICDEPTLIEPFVEGNAVRIQIIGKSAWQIQLGGDDWKKSIEHNSAQLVEADSRLVNDTQMILLIFGMELGATDYIIDNDDVPHLLEFNHIPNVTRFPEIRGEYMEYAKRWLNQV